MTFQKITYLITSIYDERLVSFCTVGSTRQGRANPERKFRGVAHLLESTLLEAVFISVSVILRDDWLRIELIIFIQSNRNYGLILLGDPSANQDSD